MSGELLIGVLIGSLVTSILLIGGLWVAQLLDRSGKEKEIQARLNRACRTIEENETLLQQTMEENSKLVSDYNIMRQVCGDITETTLVYFENNPAIFGERDRAKLVEELYTVLEYCGRNRTQPVALLEHLNGGSNGEQLSDAG